MYRKLPKELTQMSLEQEILDFWDRENIFIRSLEINSKFPRFNFFEGPPTANGKPGVHHVISRTIKDIGCRYKAMTGYYVERKGGWDSHGLPVEISVEKQLGLSNKREILDYGVENFNKHCKESVFTYLKEWEFITRRIGFWLDLENAYITYQPYYIQSIWWIIAQFFNAGLVYKGHKVLPYCARCGTGLSDHEVALGYQDTEDPSIYVMMKLKSPLPGETEIPENTYFLVWTTTPWTLLSNLALAVHMDYEYLLVENDGRNLLIVKERADAVLGEGNYRILRKFKGSELKDLDYEPLFDFVESDKRSHYVLLADYVTTDDGTGIVHIAPAFGKEDYEVGKRCDLPLVQLVDERGNISPEATPFAGKWFKDADPEIVNDLKNRGLVFKVGTMVHSYPFCWRCESPLIQYARNGWYIRTTAFKDEMIRENDRIKWYPPQIGSGRFGEWLRNNVDWAISRERFWGTPLNIWICDDCGKTHAVESFAQLREMSIEPIPEDFNPHKPDVDYIKLKCPKCSGQMTRTPEVIDCWFDSGSMPFAQYGYPFGISEEEFMTKFPADFIAEGVDQTRGWFYTLLAISTFLKGVSSYKTCVSIELILDKNGRKMSKSKDNVADPFKVIEKFGADPLRWYFLTTSQPWLPTRFDEDSVNETLRKFFDTLRNTYNFFALYADIDGFIPDGEVPKKLDNVMDQWLVSRLNTLIAQYREWMDDYQMTRAARGVQNFVIDELSNWYVRRNRRRYWGSGLYDDKLVAYKVLWQALITVCELMAPIAPITPELLWRELTKSGREKWGDSVHFRQIAKPNFNLIDEQLEMQMGYVIKLVELGRLARNIAKLNVRQPLSQLIGVVPQGTELTQALVDVVKEELNIKSILFSQDEKIIYEYNAQPNFKTLGNRFKSEMNHVKELIESMTSDEVCHGMENGDWSIMLDDHPESLTEEGLVIKVTPKPEFTVTSSKDITVAINTKITPELRAEGLARETVNRIQNTRKEAGLEVTDRIELALVTMDEELRNSIEMHKKEIANETLASKLHLEPLENPLYTREWILGQVKLQIMLSKIDS